MSGDVDDTETTGRTAPAPWLIALTAVVTLLVAVRLALPFLVDPDPFLDGWLVYRRTVESGIAVVAVAWALRGLRVDWLVRALGQGRLVLLGVVVLFMGVTQYTSLFGTQYPFSAWSMYSRPVQETHYPTVTIERPGGNAERVVLASVLPSVTPRPFVVTLLVLAHLHDDGVEWATDLAGATLLELGTRAGATTGERVVLALCTVAEPTPDEPSRCRESLGVVVPDPGGQR